VTGAAEPDYLTVDDLLEIAAGVLPEVAVRDSGGLASAAARPATTVFGADAYPSFAEKAAALMHSLARNQSLVDGNKRLAWSATRASCLLNGRDIRYDVGDAERLVLGVAAGMIDVLEFAVWLSDHLVDVG
jgi:death-on-curing protein